MKKTMSILRDRFTVGLLATAAISVGVCALYWPVSLDSYDRWGARISCGSALDADYSQAATTGGMGLPVEASVLDRAVSTDYVAQCRSATWWRRGWTVVTIAVGAGVLLASLAASRRQVVER
jgi:hypothetical protein